MKVIVIDDEITALDTFLHNVIDEDVEYKMFMNNPLQAIEYLKENDVSGAFIDILMPQINGVELAKRMFEVSKHLKVVFLTGYAKEKAAIDKEFKGYDIAWCFKPYQKSAIKDFLESFQESRKEHREIRAVTFGTFDLFINNKPIKFLSSKSRELMALLIDRKGSTLTMSEAITYMWPDKPLPYSKKLYRDAVWRLRKVLNDYDLDNLVSFKRGILILNKEGITCDLWDFLGGRDGRLYVGKYLESYDWSLDTLTLLDNYKSK